MKKLFFLFVSFLATTCLWAYDFQSGDLYYNITSSSAPFTVEVTYEYRSSYNYSGLTTATIPENVTYNGATYSVTSIGDYAFYYCSSLTSVTIPNSVTYIAENAFENCSSLTSVTIPDKVTTIGSEAFYKCSSLTSVTIPNSVTRIREGAFGRCSSLTSIIIPNSVTEVGGGLFYGCSLLESIVLSENISSISHMYNVGGFFENCSSLTSITIPNSVTSIGDAAFEDCSSLTSVTIPNSVTTIGKNAFAGCSSLTSVTLPNRVTSIPPRAFWGCSSLTSVTIPDKITSIGQGAFEDCSSLTSVTIPNSVTYIADYAFENCSSLTSVTIPNKVTTIRASAFLGCSSLTSVTIPNSVTSIGDAAFAGCSSLTSVTINSDAIVKKNYSYESNLSHIFGSQVTEYIIGERVTSIGEFAFAGCSSLTSVTIPNSVTSIGKDAFSSCSSLTLVTINSDAIVSHCYMDVIFGSQVTKYIIGESVTSIRDFAFYNCFSLTSVIISNGVTSIGGAAFLDCSSLTSVTIPNSVTSIGEEAFAGTRIYNDNSNWEDGVLYIDDCLIKAKESISEKYTIKENTRLIAYGAFEDCSSLTSVTISNGVTSIGGAAFMDCSSLTSVTIGESVTSIGDGAFCRCSSLTSVIISNGVTSIGEGAFAGCSSLTSVTIGESVTSIGNYTFSRCSSLTSVTIPNSVTSIGEGAFLDCSSLTLVTIGNGVTSIGEGAFAGCSSLTSVTINSDAIVKKAYSYYSSISHIFGSQVTEYIIGERVTSIGEEAFRGCSSLTSVTIGNSVTSIGYYAFRGCSSLTSLTIGNGVTSIGEGAFAGCSLTIVVCKATDVPNIEVYAFDDFSESHATLYVPKASLDEYNSTEPWSNFKHILPIEDSGEEPSNPDDEEDDGAITCAEAVSICQQTGTTATTKEYTIRGYVTKIETVYSEQYDNITFWMADTSPMQMDNSSNSVTSLSDYPNIALGKSTTASSSEDSGTLPEYINDGNFNTRWSSEWQDNEYISIDLEQYSFIDHITLHWETAYASQFAILITDEQPSSSTLSLPLPSSATYYQSSGDVQTIPVAKSGRYITLIGIERATAYGISLYELEAYGMPLLQAYCVKPIQNTDKYVQIGDYVEAVGTLVNYGGTTPEINAGGTYTILTKHEENGSTTSVENTNTPSPMTNCQKIIRNGQLLILRDGKTYNVMGQEL